MTGRRHLSTAGLFFATVLAGALVLGVCAAIVVPIGHALATKSVSVTLPDPTLQPLELRSVVYDDSGDPIATLYGNEDRAYVGLKHISPVLQHAVLAAEDRNFYQHGGVDWRGVGRALTRNLDAGSVLQGGSTITQQLVKNTMFTDPKRDLSRKTKEAVLAIALEDRYSKRTILEQYLNTVYFGNGAYGVQAAAERYFNTTPAQITLAQSAMLAAMIANPDQRDPLHHPDETARWRGHVLDEMVRAHWATAAQADAARAAPLPTKVLAPAPEGALDAFVEQAKRQLLTDPRLGSTYQERYNRLFEGGLQIHTTLDLRMQFFAQLAVQHRLPQGGEYDAAMIVIDNNSGGVRAMVPGTTFQHAGLNLATQGLRQTGSSFKGITLAAALEDGFSPNDTVNANGHCTFTFPHSPPWNLQNYEGESLGTVTLTDALAKSSNCAFARVALAIGPQQIVDMAHRLGISRPLEAVPSITLGTQSVTVLDMAQAYSTIADDGVRHDAHFIDHVDDSNGKLLFSNATAGQQVLTPQNARTETWMLTHVITGGTATQSLGDFPRPAAGKTGTNDQHRDAWFVGYTPQLTAAVWMGNPNAQVPIDVNGTLVVGGMYPAQMWGDFMASALSNQAALPFIPPDMTEWPRAGYITEDGRNVSAPRQYSSERRSSTTTGTSPVTQATPPPPAPVVSNPPRQSGPRPKPPKQRPPIRPPTATTGPSG